MPLITALLHTMNDARRLGRSLEMLLPCSELLIVDHQSDDATRRVASSYGARIVDAERYPAAKHYLDVARHDWIFCMQAGESISESLQASLYEWSTQPDHAFVSSLERSSVFSVFVRQQTGARWIELPAAETRLIPRNWTGWHGQLPATEPTAIALEGELLRFDAP